MSSKHDDEIHERIQRLEKRLENIEKALDIKSSTPKDREEINADQPDFQNFFNDSEDEQVQYARRFSKYLKSDFWIGKIGILMLIAGVAYFFTYAISEGWMGQTAQLVAGTIFGALLHIGGKRVHSNVLGLRPVLLGGSIVTFYATLLAGVLLYGLFPVWFAVILVFAILIFAARTATDEENPWIAGIATMGALLTVVIFSENLNAMSVVTSGWIVTLLALWMYLKFNWRMVFAVTWIASLLISVALISVDTFNFDESFFYKLTVAAQINSYWVIAIIIPHIFLARGADTDSVQPKGGLDFSVVVAYLIIPLASTIVINNIWNPTDLQNALIFFTFAGLHHGWGFYLYKQTKSSDREARLAFYSGQMLLTGGIFILIDGPLFWIIFSAQGALWIVYLTSVSFWWKLPGHLVMLLSTLYLGWWFEEQMVTGLFDAESLGALIVISMFAFVALKKKSVRDLYGLAVHLMFMGWIYKMCSLYDTQEMAATVSWFLYVSVLITLGFWKNIKKIRTVSFITLLVITAKLLFFDITNVSPLIRTVILLVLGGILLGLSYRFGMSENENKRE